MDRGGAGYDQWVAELEIEFTVGADNNITGSGFGEFVSSDCVISGCTCAWDMSSISITITGKKENDQLHLQVNPTAQMIETEVCPSTGTSSTDLFGQLYACQPATNGLSDFTIEARDGAVHTFRGGLSENFTGDGELTINLSNK